MSQGSGLCEVKSGGDKDFHSPILAVTIVTQQINS